MALGIDKTESRFISFRAPGGPAAFDRESHTSQGRGQAAREVMISGRDQVRRPSTSATRRSEEMPSASAR